MTTVSPSAYGYLGAAYGNPLATAGNASAGTTGSSAAAGATTVTISEAARALLASQDSAADFSTVTTDARAALNALYAAANVKVPLTSDGKPTVDLSGLDRRAVYAIASNSQGIFTPDEQSLASQELQKRLDATIGPALNAAKLVGDYSTLYKTALAYFDAMSPEEQADLDRAKARAALAQGYQQTLQNPGQLPQSIPNDPVAAFVTRAAQDGSGSGSFSDTASQARAALDAQYASAKAANTFLNLDPNRRTGQAVDFSTFSNQSLSAITLNEGGRFSPQEAYAAKQALSARTRASLLSAFQQGVTSGDPRAASLGLIQQYQAMTPEERQAAGISSSLLDLAVSHYKSTTQLMSMFGQTGGSGGESGTPNILAYM